MKSLRSVILMLAVGISPAFLASAYAQQEVDPDHFEQPAQVHASSGASVQHKSASSHHRAANAKMASKHAMGKSHHHQHVAA